MIISVLALAVLLYASVVDIKTKEIPNRVHLMLLLIGIFSILFYKYSLLVRLISFLIVGIWLLIVGLLGSLGGGDIKLGACLTFGTGLFPALVSLVVGFLLATILFVIQKIRKKEITVTPMAPFFTIGFIFVSILKQFIPKYYFVI